MVALICFVLAVLVSAFKSKSRLAKAGEAPGFYHDAKLALNGGPPDAAIFIISFRSDGTQETETPCQEHGL